MSHTMNTNPGSRHLYTYQDLVYWAENGMIVLQDERDGSRVVIDPVTWAERADSVGATAKHCQYPSERDQHIRTANEMIKCCDEAAAQGSPNNPLVIAYRERHNIGKIPVVNGVGPGRRIPTSQDVNKGKGRVVPKRVFTNR